MPYFEVNFEIAGEKQIARRFENFTANLDDLVPAFKEILKSFYAGEKKQFETEGGWGSGGWLPLSPSYAARKDPSLKVLEESGKLGRALSGEVPANTQGNIEIIESNQLIMGTDIDFAIYHQRGTRNMPMRKPIEIPEAERKKWTSIIHKHIWKGGVRR